MRWLLADLALLAVVSSLVVTYDFGVIAPPWSEPSISGVVFRDLNGDGEHDWGEPGLKEWQVLLCVLDMCRSTTTGAGGSYHFDDARGEYGIGVHVPFGWQRVGRTSGSGQVSVGEGERKRVDMAVRFVGEEVSGFSGSVWKDGAPAPDGTRVEALVGEKVCGETTASGIRESGYSMWVVSAEEKGGCGEEGAEVRFRVGGDMANQTAEWHDGDSAAADLFVGPDLAVFEGSVSVYRPDTTYTAIPDGTPVQAYVANQLCGASTTYTVHPGPNMYQVAVLPDALRAGCGREGASVTFTIDGQPANEEAVWRLGVHRLQLTTASHLHPAPHPK